MSIPIGRRGAEVVERLPEEVPSEPGAVSQRPVALPDGSADPWSPRRRQGNNFDFLRLALAVLVVYSHTFQVLLGNAGFRRTEPIYLLSRGQVTGGGLAVDAFFAISGFLIVHSWLSSRGLWSFLARRILRIYPAFIVVTAACLLLFGPLASHNGADYWRGLSPRQVVHMLALQKVEAPGVASRFRDHFGIDEPTWTISYEFWCYLGVAALGGLGFYRRRRGVLLLFAAYLALSALHENWPTAFGRCPEFLCHGLIPVPFTDEWPRLVAFYLSGVCFFLYRHRIPRSRRLFWLSVGTLALCAALGRGLDVAMPLFGTYALFYLAFGRRPRLAALSRRADLSYGIYLYAWPIQVLLVLYWGQALTPYTLMPLALALTTAFAWLSWHLVEAPCLRLKPR